MQKTKYFAVFLVIASLGFNVSQAQAEDDFFTAGAAAEASSVAASTTASSTPSVIESEAVPEAVVSQPSSEVIAQPMIRVAVWKTNEAVKFQSPFIYQVYAGDDLKGSLPPNELATLKFKSDIYSVKSASLSFESKDFVRFVPVDQGSYFNVVNLTRKTSTKSKINYNSYREEMIYRYSPRMKISFVINRLPLDSYVAGIGEAPNESPEEYLKALLVAARSYGYFYINYGDNNKKMFDVYASTIDQLYLGYNCEIKRPKVAKAAEDTFGQMVLYNDKPVITPYFGNSSGKTMTWKSVWGGQDKPWLTPVECSYDKGKKKWGHGVGMSTHDALHRAGDDGWNYNQLLSHYFTSTSLERMY